MDFDIGTLARQAPEFNEQLAALKLRLAETERWYPYGTLSNLDHLNLLLSEGNRDLQHLVNGKAIADIGAADGDLAFFLAKLGFEVDVIDWGPTNFNGLAGVRLLAEHFALPVTIHEIDLDAQFSLPRENYGLVIFLGILYHLQNPYFVLQRLSYCSKYLLLSTRIAAESTDGNTDFQNVPMAYLVDKKELNNDPTNYWIFSLFGLQRLLSRTGWIIQDEITVGCTDGTSNPSSSDHDERAFMLLRSVREN